MATFKRLTEYWSGDIAHQLWDAPDEVKDRFAELFDLQATILPDESKNGYHINMSVNVPLEMEGNKPGAYDMVFSPSRGGLKGGEDLVRHIDVIKSSSLTIIIPYVKVLT
jgi:hypothetical protein